MKTDARLSRGLLVEEPIDFYDYLAIEVIENLLPRDAKFPSQKFIDSIKIALNMLFANPFTDKNRSSLPISNSNLNKYSLALKKSLLKTNHNACVISYEVNIK